MIKDNLRESHISKISGHEIQVYQSSSMKVPVKRCFSIHLMKIRKIMKLNQKVQYFKCLTKMISINVTKSEKYQEIVAENCKLNNTAVNLKLFQKMIILISVSNMRQPIGFILLHLGKGISFCSNFQTQSSFLNFSQSSSTVNFSKLSTFSKF